MERKTLGPLEVKEAARGIATAVFSRFGGPPDADGDITEPGAFTDGTVVAVSPYNHSSALSGTLPVGKATIRVRPDRAEAEVQFFLGTTAGREAFETVKELGSLVQWSYAYDIVDAEPGTWQGRRVQILKRLDPYEISPVLRGAGRETLTVAGSVKCDGCATRHQSGDLDARTRAELAAIAADMKEHERKEAAATRMWLAEVAANVQRAEMDAIASNLKSTAADEQQRERTAMYWSESAAPSAVVEHAAWAALKVCSRDLGIDLPLLRFFAPETPAERRYADVHGDRDWPYFVTDEKVLGAYQPAFKTVWIARDLRADRLIEIVAHEVRHAAGGDEDEARTYQSRWSLGGLN